MLTHAWRVLVSLHRERKKARSSHWRSVRKTHLQAHPLCEACGRKRRVQVHHIEPYHLVPAKELEPTNLLSLCMGRYECHLRIGHGDDWKAYNARVIEHAKAVMVTPAHRLIIENEAKVHRVYKTS